jgi:uncharacterized Zn finger protein
MDRRAPVNVPEVFRICPSCGSNEVPTLVVQAARLSTPGLSWRCHQCQTVWTDAEYYYYRHAS